METVSYLMQSTYIVQNILFHRNINTVCSFLNKTTCYVKQCFPCLYPSKFAYSFIKVSFICLYVQS